MANIRTSIVTRQTALDSRTALINAGGAGTIEIRDGTQPASSDDAATGTLLATLTFSATSFGAADGNATATANAVTSDASADATGVASWARILSGGGATIFDCDAGEAADNATMTLANKNIAAGAAVNMTSFTLTQPN